MVHNIYSIHIVSWDLSEAFEDKHFGQIFSFGSEKMKTNKQTKKKYQGNLEGLIGYYIS